MVCCGFELLGAFALVCVWVSLFGGLDLRCGVAVVLLLVDFVFVSVDKVAFVLLCLFINVGRRCFCVGVLCGLCRFGYWFDLVWLSCWFDLMLIVLNAMRCVFIGC